MNTPNILKAVSASALILVSSGVSAGHEAPYYYDEASDTIVFSHYGNSASAHVQLASSSPVSIAEQHDSAADTTDWFLDQ